MIGKLHGIVLDCPDPDRLAGFYAELLGMVRVHDEDDWVVIGDAADRPGLGFHRISDYRPRPGRRRPATDRSTGTSTSGLTTWMRRSGPCST